MIIAERTGQKKKEQVQRSSYSRPGTRPVKVEKEVTHRKVSEEESRKKRKEYKRQRHVAEAADVVPETLVAL